MSPLTQAIAKLILGQTALSRCALHKTASPNHDETQRTQEHLAARQTSAINSKRIGAKGERV
jgi:hypothetical protein